MLRVTNSIFPSNLPRTSSWLCLGIPHSKWNKIPISSSSLNLTRAATYYSSKTWNLWCIRMLGKSILLAKQALWSSKHLYVSKMPFLCKSMGIPLQSPWLLNMSTWHPNYFLKSFGGYRARYTHFYVLWQELFMIYVSWSETTKT